MPRTVATDTAADTKVRKKRGRLTLSAPRSFVVGNRHTCRVAALGCVKTKVWRMRNAHTLYFTQGRATNSNKILYTATRTTLASQRYINSITVTHSRSHHSEGRRAALARADAGPPQENETRPGSRRIGAAPLSRALTPATPYQRRLGPRIPQEHIHPLRQGSTRAQVVRPLYWLMARPASRQASISPGQ